MNRQSIAILSDRLFSNPEAAIHQAKVGDWGIGKEILDVATDVLVSGIETKDTDNRSGSFKYINKQKLDELIVAYGKLIDIPEAPVMSDALRWSYSLRIR